MSLEEEIGRRISYCLISCEQYLRIGQSRFETPMLCVHGNLSLNLLTGISCSLSICGILNSITFQRGISVACRRVQNQLSGLSTGSRLNGGTEQHGKGISNIILMRQHISDSI